MLGHFHAHSSIQHPTIRAKVKNKSESLNPGFRISSPHSVKRLCGLRLEKNPFSTVHAVAWIHFPTLPRRSPEQTDLTSRRAQIQNTFFVHLKFLVLHHGKGSRETRGRTAHHGERPETRHEPDCDPGKWPHTRRIASALARDSSSAEAWKHFSASFSPVWEQPVMCYNFFPRTKHSFFFYIFPRFHPHYWSFGCVILVHKFPDHQSIKRT